jgi:integrase/recombinase XerD
MKVRAKNLHNDSEYLFFSRSGNKLSNDDIQKMLKRINPKIHPHQFRHYYIQSLLKKGVNLFYISRLVGHDSIETTKTYLDGIDNENILDSVKKFSNL